MRRSPLDDSPASYLTIPSCSSVRGDCASAIGDLSSPAAPHRRPQVIDSGCSRDPIQRSSNESQSRNRRCASSRRHCRIGIEVSRQIRSSPREEPDVGRTIRRQHYPLQVTRSVGARNLQLHAFGFAQLPPTGVTHLHPQSQKVVTSRPQRRTDVRCRFTIGDGIRFLRQSEDADCNAIRDARESSRTTPTTPGINCSAAR